MAFIILSSTHPHKQTTTTKILMEKKISRVGTKRGKEPEFRSVGNGKVLKTCGKGLRALICPMRSLWLQVGKEGEGAELGAVTISR